jgi:predicted RNA binding protein YcfA (HicA-like mRNA interferase family)
MSKLPIARPNELIRALQKTGFIVKRKSGSHFFLTHTDGRATSISVHSKTIPPGTLRAILKQTEISADTIKELL